MCKIGSDGKFTAELITFLARFGLREGANNSLTGAQWAALRFFSRAIQTSRTISAFADYRLTTRGTASQTVKRLVARQLLQRTRLQTDGRIIQIDITPEGRCLAEMDPFKKLAQTIARLPKAEQAILTKILEGLTDRLAEKQQERRFGPCATCLYLRKSIGPQDKETIHFCRLLSKPLLIPKMDTICMDYKADEKRH